MKLPSIVLLSATDAGYERLVDLISRAYLGDEGGGPSVHIQLFLAGRDRTEGLIALTGASTGPIDMALREGHAAQAEARLLSLKQRFRR